MKASVVKSEIESQWPLAIGGRKVSYAFLARTVRRRLVAAGLKVTGFSHFALVVFDIQSALNTLAKLTDEEWKRTAVVWGRAFGCHVACRRQDGIEIEVIQPVDPGFLLESLRANGEGLHHVCFNVEDIGLSIRVLKRNGERMADRRIRGGLHGRIGFVQPGRICPIYVEICEPKHPCGGCGPFLGQNIAYDC